MSEKARKNNKKKKQTGFDIMYRVVTAVLAAAVFPLVYFMNLVYYALDWTNIIHLINNIKDILNSGSLMEGLQNLLNPSAGSTQQNIEITEGYICLAKWDEFRSLINTVSSGETDYKELLFHNAELRPLVISLALFAAVIILALVILIVSAVANKPKVIAAISGIGVLLGGASDIIFITGFANPLVNGDKNLSQIFGIDDSFLGSIAANVLGDVIELRYDNAFFAVLFIMIAIFIWSISVMIVNSDDKAEKALREAKKAEKKAKQASRKAKKEAKKAEKATRKAEEIVKEEKSEQEAE